MKLLTFRHLFAALLADLGTGSRRDAWALALPERLITRMREPGCDCGHGFFARQRLEPRRWVNGCVGERA